MQIYTDGSCSKNPGPGGWAAIIFKNGEPNAAVRISGGEKKTTNNRMEMTAVLEALRYLDKNKDVPLDESIEVYCDSAYIVNCFKDGWWKKWRMNGWTNSAGKPVENKDLWESMLTIVNRRKVVFKKVKGHADDPINNECDILAKKAVVKD